MKEFKALKFLDLFKNLFVKMGIDYPVMRSILKVKLTMDRRRSTTIMNGSNAKEGSNSFGMAMLLYAFFGGMLSLFMLLPAPIFFVMSIILAAIMFFITLTMISDFSAVLLDLRDKNIILKAPVEYKTLNMAKTIHIVVYLITIMIAFTAIPLLVSLFKFGIVFFLVLFMELILMAMSVIFFTSIIYYVILSLFDGEKLKDLINYVQIVFSIVITVGQQLSGRVFSLAGDSGAFTPKWWCYLVPSFWMSAPLAMLKEGAISSHYIYLTILGIIMPLLLLIIYIKIIAPRFEIKLQKMASVDSGVKVGRLKGWFYEKRAKLFCKDPVERGLFKFIVSMTSSERKLKLALYPTLAMSFIFPFIFVFISTDSKKSLGDVIAEAGNGKQYFFIYATVLIASSCISIVSKSENYKAAWIYRTAPVERPSIICKAAIKAVLAKFTIPVFIFQSIVFLALCGLRILPDIIIMFFSIILVSLIMITMDKKVLPFSKDINPTKAENAGMALLIMFLGLIMGIMHFALSYVKAGSVAFGVIVVIGGILMWRYAFRFGWEEVEL